MPSRRRLVSGAGLAAFFAIGGNFGGVTSAILSSNQRLEQASRAVRLDAVVPLGGFKRHYVLNASASPTGSFASGFEFLFPADWLADLTVAQRNARLTERSLDPLSGADERRKQKLLKAPVVAAAYGPRGSTGETNVSVVKSPIDAGFDLRDMGTPEEAAARFLASVAPAGSGRTAYLSEASSRVGRDGTLFYTIEYVVRNTTQGWVRSNVSVYGTKDDVLYTLNAQVPMAGSPVPRPDLRQVAPALPPRPDEADEAGVPAPAAVVSLPPAPALLATYRAVARSFELTT